MRKASTEKAAKKPKTKKKCKAPKESANTPSFVYTLKLRYCKAQEERLDKIFRAANNMYNDLVRNRLDALKELEENERYRSLQDQIRALYQDKTLPKKERDKLVAPLGEERDQMRKDAGLSCAKHSFDTFMQPYRNQYRSTLKSRKCLVNSQVAKQIAESVRIKFDRYINDNGKKIRFRRLEDCRSIESSASETGIVFKGDRVMVGQGFEIKVKLADTDYERECLEHRIKYCRIIRIPWKKGWLYKLQLILEGTPPVIRNKDGEPKHTIGKGEVGLDIGLQDIAVVGDEGAMIPELAPNVDNAADEIADIQRKLDHKRRLSNPDFFDEQGRIVPINKLPKERLTKRGKRVWIKSNTYRRLEQRCRYLQAKAARTRKYDHQALANKILRYGDVFNIEKMRWQGLAKKAKLQKREDGTYKRRKRFGKSILMKSPGTLVTLLEEKALRYGGQLREIDTFSTKASQYNHLTGEYKKIPLGQRWKTFEYNAGKYVIQRDLYSAFLLSCMNKTLNGFEQGKCNRKFDQFIVHHERAVREREDIDPKYKHSHEKYIERHLVVGQMKFE